MEEKMHLHPIPLIRPLMPIWNLLSIQIRVVSAKLKSPDLDLLAAVSIVEVLKISLTDLKTGENIIVQNDITKFWTFFVHKK